jgi:phage tail sheath gpL-like
VPESPYYFTGAYSSVILESAQKDPALPFQTLEIKGVLAPKDTQLFTNAENNNLLYDGISTFYAEKGKIYLQRMITMYQTDSFGIDSVSYLNLETMFTLMFLRYDFKATIARKYPRAKLADDGVMFEPGQQVMTPNTGIAEAISIFKSWERKGLVENFSQYANELICVRSLNDRDRLEWILPPDLINQFRIGAVTLQFLL